MTDPIQPKPPQMPQMQPEAGAGAAPDASGLPRDPRGSRAPWKWILLIVGLGVVVRALLVWGAMPLDIQSDEANYIYLALALERFGIFLDQHRYFWPPGYPWLISQFVSPESGVAGLDTLRGFQVLLSGVIGTTTMLFAWRLFSSRAAVAAGLLWALHLPLGAFTHLLWNETVFLSLFLPALWHLLVGMDGASSQTPSRATWRLLLSGVLFGLALYVKELPLYLVPAAGLLVFFRCIAESTGPLDALRRGLIVPLTALVVLTPWTLRNQEVYGRTVLAGATLGENVYVGLNARYLNFDTHPLRKLRAAQKLPGVETYTRQFFTAPPRSWVPSDVNGDGSIDPRDAAWQRAEELPHAIDRHGEQIGRGLRYALDNPAWTVRTRIKKWADLVAPMSFFTRHHALGKYPPGSALSGPLRKPSILIAASQSALVMLLALAGFFFTLQRGPGRQLLGIVFAYVAVTSSLVAMSRFRVPVEPFLIVLSAGFLAHGWAGRGNARMGALRVGAFALCVAVLFGLWWISGPETLMQLEMGMAGSEGGV